MGLTLDNFLPSWNSLLHTHTEKIMPSSSLLGACRLPPPHYIISVFPIRPHFLDLRLFDYSSPSLCSAEVYFLSAFALPRCNTSTEDLPVDKKRLFCMFYSLYSYLSLMIHHLPFYNIRNSGELSPNYLFPSLYLCISWFLLSVELNIPIYLLSFLK